MDDLLRDLRDPVRLLLRDDAEEDPWMDPVAALRYE